MTNKAEINKNKCAKKIKNLFLFTVMGLFFIIGIIPGLIPLIIIIIASLVVNKNVSIERVLKGLGILECFESFSKEYKDIIVSKKILEKSRNASAFNKKREILRKRKELASVLSNISSPKNEIKQTKEIVDSFENTNQDFFTGSEDNKGLKIKKESVMNSFNSKEKVKVIEKKEVLKEKKTNLFDDKTSSFSSSSSSIWDSYDSVMDDFKK